MTMEETDSDFTTTTVPNSKINVGIFIKIALAGGKNPCYGTIIRLINNSYLMTDLPFNNNRDKLVLIEGDEVECDFTLFDGNYTFKTSFVSCFPDLNLVIMNMPPSLVKNNMRKHTRVPVIIPVRVDDETDGLVLTISVGGLLLTTSKKFASGDVVKLDFKMEQFHLNVRGQVRRISGHNGYGIKFLDLNREMFDVIERYALRTTTLEGAKTTL